MKLIILALVLSGMFLDQSDSAVVAKQSDNAVPANGPDNAASSNESDNNELVNPSDLPVNGPANASTIDGADNIETANQSNSAATRLIGRHCWLTELDCDRAYYSDKEHDYNKTSMSCYHRCACLGYNIGNCVFTAECHTEYTCQCSVPNERLKPKWCSEDP